MKGILLITSLFFALFAKAQAPSEIKVSNIEHHGFTLHFTTPLETGISLNIKNETTAQRSITEMSEVSKTHTLNVQNLEPGCIYETYLNYSNGQSYGPYYYGTRSTSSGDIKVYFNHEVDLSKAIPGNNAVYLNETIDDTIVAYINRATLSIDFALYNVEMDTTGTIQIANILKAMRDAHYRGVKVRVVYDSTGNASIQKFMPKLTQQIGRAFRLVSSGSAIMHNKFMVIDAEHTNANKPIVWTGSINWSTYQLLEDRNHAIIIQDQTLAKNYKKEFEEMFGSTGMFPNNNLYGCKFGADKTDNTVHEFNIGGRDVRCHFSPTDNIRNKIVETINSTNSDCSIAMMMFNKDEMATAINDKFQDGVLGIHILLDDDDGVYGEFATLKQVIGAQRIYTWAYSSDIMHHKFMVVDNFKRDSDPTVLTGSHNWTSGAETINDENTLIIQDSLIANQFYQAFAKLYTQNGGVIGIRENMLLSNLDAYPNPTKNNINIQFNDEERNVEANYILTDLAGRTLDRGTKPKMNSNLYLDMSNYKAGVYFVKIESPQGNSLVKIIRE